MWPSWEDGIECNNKNLIKQWSEKILTIIFMSNFKSLTKQYENIYFFKMKLC